MLKNSVERKKMHRWELLQGAFHVAKTNNILYASVRQHSNHFQRFYRLFIMNNVHAKCVSGVLMIVSDSVFSMNGNGLKKKWTEEQNERRNQQNEQTNEQTNEPSKGMSDTAEQTIEAEKKKPWSC